MIPYGLRNGHAPTVPSLFDADAADCRHVAEMNEAPQRASAPTFRERATIPHGSPGFERHRLLDADMREPTSWRSSGSSRSEKRMETMSGSRHTRYTAETVNDEGAFRRSARPVTGTSSGAASSQRIAAADS
jgi:hypothetical protein